ncbi:MAG: cation:proton antiporter [Clostridia bacterium]|nr:cation:proton antiporter [Clostridia bacterium]
MEALLYLAVAMAAGLLLTRVVKLVRLPNVTGYLIAGLLIGPYCFGLLPEAGVGALNVVTTVALGFIAFSIGGEFKLSSMKRIGSKAMVITLCQAFGAVILVDVALILCGFDLPLCLVLGAIATATAPAATLLVIRQYRAKGEVTGTLLPVVAMDDALGLMIFSVSLAIASTLASGVTLNFGSMVVTPLIEIVLSLVIGGALGGLIALATRVFHSKGNRLGLCVCAVFAGVYMASALGLSDLLLCMAAGGVFANLGKGADDALQSADEWTPPLFLLFFVISGAQLDISALPAVGLLGLIYLAARSAGKYLGAFAGASAVHASPNVRKYLGITLLPQAGVAIGMAQIALTALPEYGAQIQAVVLAATLIYELVGPVLTKVALARAGEITLEAKRPRMGKPRRA